MTREELKTHCEKQIEMCEFWAIGKGEKPSGKVYEEHKLILELLEQEPISETDIILTREEYKDVLSSEYDNGYSKGYSEGFREALTDQQSILDKIRAEIEQLPTTKCTETHRIYIDADDFKKNVLVILDKYKAESEEEE